MSGSFRVQSEFHRLSNDVGEGPDASAYLLILDPRITLIFEICRYRFILSSQPES